MVLHRYKLALIGILFTLSGIGTLFMPALASAAAKPAATPPPTTNSTFTTDACSGVAAVSGSNACTQGSGDTLTRIVRIVVNVLSFVVGATAIIMIIFGGFKYITAGGDSNRVSSAKNTIIYALVGLVIVAFAQFIVHFALSQANAAQTVCTTRGQTNCTAK